MGARSRFGSLCKDKYLTLTDNPLGKKAKYIVNHNKYSRKFKESCKKALGISTVHVTPSSADYTKGTFIRYFVKDSRLNRVVEVDKPKYVEQRKSGKLYRRTLKIMWYITGDPEDQTIKGYVYPGLKKKNQDVIDKAEQILSGIGKQVLTDTSQFVKK